MPGMRGGGPCPLCRILCNTGVLFLLHCGKSKAGDRVRVTAQLIRADDGFHLWSQNYDRTLENVFAIQDDISTDVAAALGSSLLTTGKTGIRNVSTENFSAYDIYLMALERQNINTNESLLSSDELFAAALDKDPNFADAKIALARNHIWKRWKAVGDGAEYRHAQALVRDVLAGQPDNLSAQVMDLFLQLAIGYSENRRTGAKILSRSMKSLSLCGWAIPTQPNRCFWKNIRIGRCITVNGCKC